MIRCSLSYLGVALLAVACTKDAAKPVPAFEGRWNGVNAATVYYTAVGGQMTRQSVSPMTSMYLVVTQDSLLFYGTQPNGLALVNRAYTRQGNVLTTDKTSIFIKELSDDRLVVRFPGFSTNIPYYEWEDSYSR